MKKINLLTLVFVVFSTLTASAQTKNSESTNFEGVITIVATITTDNKSTKKTFGMSDDGEFINTVYIKGKRKKETDTQVNLVLIEDKIKDMAYYWSPETKEGIKYCLSKINKDKDVLYNSTSGEDVCLGERKEMFGFELVKWKKTKTRKVERFGSYWKNETNIEYWAYTGWGPEYYGSQKFKGFAFGIEWYQKTSAPLQKTKVLHQSYQVTNVERKTIPESEFEIPKDIAFRTCSGYQEVFEQQNKLAQSVQKYRKEHGIDTKAGVKTEGAAQKKGEWDY